MLKKYLYIGLCLPKSFLFCIRVLPLKQAFRIPILLDLRVKVLRANGKIVIPEKAPFGKIKIGFGNVGIFDRYYSRTLLEIVGTIIFEGSAGIAHGSKVSVLSGGILTFGDKFSATAEMSVICAKKINFAAQVMVGWSSLIIDTDFHDTENPETHIRYEKEKEIVIGANTWLGTHTIILKGTVIPPDTIVAAGALCNKNYSNIKPYSVLAGCPAVVKKNNVKRI